MDMASVHVVGSKMTLAMSGILHGPSWHLTANNLCQQPTKPCLIGFGTEPLFEPFHCEMKNIYKRQQSLESMMVETCANLKATK